MFKWCGTKKNYKCATFSDGLYFVFENGSKEIFSLLQEKVLIQAVCLRTQAVSIKSLVLGLMGGLLVFRKSQKISTDSDLNFLYYVKKLQPPPSQQE